MHWLADILPFQWRIALSWISGYFAFSLFTSVLFHYHGPVIAGQMGMTWSLAGALSAVGGACLSPRVPQFGMMVAQKRYFELDHLFWKLTKIVFVLTSVSGIAIYSLVLALNYFNIALATRILSPLPIGLFIIAQCLVMLSMTCSMYMRAHKKEPIMPLNVFGAVLTLSLIWLFGRQYSAVGMALAYLLAMLIIIPLIFLIWYRCKNKWQRETLEP